jgi:hypothetical protein
VNRAEQPDAHAVQRAKRSLLKELAGNPAVLGIGVSSGPQGEPVLLVLVSDDSPELRARIPAVMAGIPVSISKSARPHKL